ncbi:MAG: hypothetical protein DHS20C16_36550 [Phycisphaerae bacterium]|nr:MAG: hypothetical protein DHS20C16_36550 [Phycisphaerae bacterium]
MLAMLLAVISGCGLDGLLSLTSSLGGDVAGQRGNADVLFINNTPFRAIFVFGAYDNLDRDTQPNLLSFSSDAATLNLEGNTETVIQQVQCARVFSIGGEGLLTRAQANLDEAALENVPLIDGVHFSSADVGEEDADAPIEGIAQPLDSNIGPDFECGSLLIYRMEFDDTGPERFRVDLTVIPAESNRGT